MDLSIIQAVAPLVTGPLVGVVAEAAKRVPAFPFDPKTAAGMRLAVLVVSSLAGFALAAIDGNPGGFNTAEALTAIVNAAVIYAGAVATHDHALKASK